MDDPWDWDNERVVSALCDPGAPFRAAQNPHKFPDSVTLENKLREHYIDGSTLLVDVNHSSLKEEIELKPFGHRCILLKEISRLRRQSQKYTEHLKDASLDQPSVLRNLAPNGSTRNTSSQSTSPRDVSTPSLIGLSGSFHHLPAGNLQPQRADILNQVVPEVISTDAQALIQGLGIESSDFGRSSLAILGLDTTKSAVCVDPSQQDQNLVNTITGPSHETYVIGSDGRKRRKLVLPQHDSTTEQTNTGEISDAVSEQNAKSLDWVMPDEPSKTSNPFTKNTATAIENDNPQPAQAMAGLLSIDQKGKRRVTPVLISQPTTSGLPFHLDSVEETARLSDLNQPELGTLGKETFAKGSLRNPGSIYLGIKSLPVEKIFYGDDLCCKNHANDVNLSDDHIGFNFIAANAFSEGQRLYVHRRLRYFYQSTIHSLAESYETKVIQVPYPSRITRKHKTLFATQYESMIHGVTASKVIRPINLARSPYSMTHNVQKTGPLPLETITNDDATNWDYLAKWEHIDSGEILLPKYGDSGSEGQYDLDTWQEMEDEQRLKIKAKRSLGRLRSSFNVGKVQEVIEQAMERFLDQWKSRRLDSLNRKAWQLWKNSRRVKTERHQIASLEVKIRMSDERLEKLQKGILKENWSSDTDIMRQCEILQPTVFDREDWRWEISLLQQSQPPEKPQKVKEGNKVDQRKRKRFTKVETQSCEESSDSLNGFVISDESEGTGGSQIKFENESRTTTTGSEGEDSSIRGKNLRVRTVSDNQDIPKSQEEEALFLTPPVSSPEEGSNFVDLTMCSSGPEAQIATTRASRRRATLLCSDGSDQDSSEDGERQRKPKISQTINAANVIDLDSSSDINYHERAMAVQTMPSLHEIEKISRMDPRILEERQDRKRILVYSIAKVAQVVREATFAHLQEPLPQIRAEVWKAFKSFRGFSHKVRGMTEGDSEVSMRIAGWYISWTVPIVVIPFAGVKENHLKMAEADQEGFEDFFNFLCECQRLDFFQITQNKDSQGRSLSEQQDSSESCRELEPYTNRKRAVAENKQASQFRQKAQERVREMEIRHSHLKQRLQEIGRNDSDASNIVINPGMLDGEKLIYLNPSIGSRIQPHQKDGVRFIWRELVEDHASNQGCLLAQTMGLGKTMQVITFLVTLAEAAKSSDQGISQQIPKRLRKSQTLVLCPPGLIENWYEEFLMWTPQPLEDNIKDLWKVTTDLTLTERVREIQEWRDHGGVLILGYSIFRDLVKNRESGRSSFARNLDDEQHQMLTRAILDTPNIVIADEAHTAKSMNSVTRQLICQFRTGSRIALTGSPLSNNLREYYSLIDWVAPGYLGESVEFRAHYEEPIVQGLYRDSMASQWRFALKRLELFKREVQPKVHRADVSVLAARLKGKSEFVIKVPLTALQDQLYRTYVESMSTMYGGKADLAYATLWGWLYVLRLVCNHPKCFREIMLEQRSKGPKAKKAQKKKTSPTGSDDTEELLAAPEITPGMLEMQLAPFEKIGDVASVTLAYKMVILRHIVGFSLQASDKVLVFSHCIQTLDYAQNLLKEFDEQLQRIDGMVNPARRQELTKDFNKGKAMICLVSTRAGGTGLNLFGANRVVILDDHFNPMWEEQAIGRAYRIGQTKHVYVYRLTVGGTFEEVIHNQSLFKQQLANRALDMKNPVRQATRGFKHYFRLPREVPMEDLGSVVGKDELVMDRILSLQVKAEERFICSIVPCETFHLEDDEPLTAEEKKEVEQEALQQTRRMKPTAFKTPLMNATSSSTILSDQRSLVSTARAPSSPVTLND